MSFGNSGDGRSGRTTDVVVKACPAFENLGSRNYSNLSLSVYPGSIARGTFGVIYKGELKDDKIIVAIKKVYQDPRYKNRELLIFYKLRKHPNLVQLYHHFFSQGTGGKSDIYLNLVMEFFPESLADLLARYRERDSLPSILHVKFFMYQLLRGLGYMHSSCICHRDIKSSNLLVDEQTLVLKLCDLGSAKEIQKGGTNVAYISSRYYRAPELLFGSSTYSCSIDLWSAGCVLGEITSGNCLFMADSSIDQLVSIIQVLGTPSKKEIEAMNPVYSRFDFPDIKPAKFVTLPVNTSKDLLDLLCQLLVYKPESRIKPLRALAHPFFDDLRHPEFTVLPSNSVLPPLFDFSVLELSTEPTLKAFLVPQKHSSSEASTSKATPQKKPVKMTSL